MRAGAYWVVGIIFIAASEYFALNRHNLLWFNWNALGLVLSTLAVLVGSIAWMAFNRQSRDTGSAGDEYLLRRQAPSRWLVRVMAICCLHSAGAACFTWYVSRIAADVSSDVAISLRAQVVHTMRASGPSLTNCSTYVDLLFADGKVSTVCARPRTGRRVLWAAEKAMVVGDKVLVEGRTNFLGAVVDRISPLDPKQR